MKDSSIKSKSSRDIFEESKNKALRGGLAGMGAMVVQVSSLMWLRTTMNYQYRYGTSTFSAVKHLYKDGGVLRFYRGYIPALLQGPLSRFGDTAANSGVINYLDANESTKQLPTLIKSIFSSSVASLWRINLMPIDTTKTILQVEGKNGLPILKNKFKTGGIKSFYQGALGKCGATFIGHYPWFATYNVLNTNLPDYKDKPLIYNLCRNASIGFTASVISDCCSNSIRVVTTTKQTHSSYLSYNEALNIVIKEDGIIGLFTRGLQTRILANGLQGMLFTVLWKFFEDKLK
jgi:hypothetical protein